MTKNSAILSPREVHRARRGLHQRAGRVAQLVLNCSSVFPPYEPTTPHAETLMNWRRSTSDRRGAARFQILGRLSGGLLTNEALRICNISRGGVLLEAERPLVVGTFHTIQLQSEASVTSAHARVVRVNRSPGGPEYAIALEFIDLTPSALEMVDHLLQSGGAVSVG